MLFAMSSDGWSVNSNLSNLDNSLSTNASTLVMGGLVITLLAILVFAIFVVWVIELILMCVHKSKVRVAKQHMDESNDKLRKLKRRDDVNKYDIADAQDDVDTAYKQYQIALNKRYKHQRRFVIFLVIWLITFIGRIAIVYAAEYQVMKNTDNAFEKYMGIDSQGGAKTLNDLGTGYYDYYDY